MTTPGPRTGKPTKFATLKRMMLSDAVRDLSGVERAILRTLWLDLSGPLSESLDAPCRYTLAELTGLSGFNERTVRRALVALVEGGFIDSPKRTRNGSKTTLRIVGEVDTESTHTGHRVHSKWTESPVIVDTESTVSGHRVHPYKESEPYRTNTPNHTEDAGARTLAGVILPEGVAVTADDHRAVAGLIAHVRAVYPSGRKVHHRPPPNRLLQLAAPHLVTMAAESGSVASACDRARLAVDAVAKFAAEHPDRARYLPKLETWLADGGLDYLDPSEFASHLKPPTSRHDSPYGLPEAPDESRVGQILESLRTNRRALRGKSRRTG